MALFYANIIDKQEKSINSAVKSTFRCHFN